MKKIILFLLALITTNVYAQNKMVEDTIKNYIHNKYPHKFTDNGRMCKLKNIKLDNTFIFLGKWKLIDTIYKRSSNDLEYDCKIKIHHSEIAFSIFMERDEIKGYFDCEQIFDDKKQDYEIIEGENYYNNGKNDKLKSFDELVGLNKKSKIWHSKIIPSSRTENDEICDTSIGTKFDENERFEEDYNVNEGKKERDSIEKAESIQRFMKEKQRIERENAERDILETERIQEEILKNERLNKALKEKEAHDDYLRKTFIEKEKNEYENIKTLISDKKYHIADSVIAEMIKENKKYNTDISNILGLRKQIFDIRFAHAIKDTLKNKTGDYCFQIGINVQSNTININDTKASLDCVSPNISLGIFKKFNIRRTKESISDNEYRYKFNMIGLKYSLTSTNGYKINVDSTGLSIGNVVTHNYYSDFQISSVLCRVLTLSAGVASYGYNPFINSKCVISGGFKFAFVNLETKYVFNEKGGDFIFQCGVQPNFSFHKKLSTSDIDNTTKAIKYKQEHILDKKVIKSNGMYDAINNQKKYQKNKEKGVYIEDETKIDIEEPKRVGTPRIISRGDSTKLEYDDAELQSNANRKYDGAFLLSMLCPGVGDILVDNKFKGWHLATMLAYNFCVVNSVYNNIQANQSYSDYKSISQNAYSYNTQQNMNNKYNDVMNYDQMFKNYLITAGCIMVCDVARVIIKNEINKAKIKHSI